MAESRTPRVRNCGTMEVHERLLRTDPAYAQARIASENRFWAVRTFAGPVGRTGVTVIPVVVHVVWKTEDQKISEAQVRSQIDVLNHDYRKRNSDIGKVPYPFVPLAADARVEFELATEDPSGAATSGITWTETTKASFNADDTVKRVSTGGADAWPADRYLNLWVCKLGGGLLGYAQFPGGSAATDGVVILNTAFGTTGTASDPFNLGRTATHEVGHWLNLRHIWGDDSGCMGDDFVADTPNAAAPNYGKPTWPHITCSNGPNGDMFMNYMDYVDDDTMCMFTSGQVTRMQTSLENDRPTLGHVKDDGAVADTLKFRDGNGPSAFGADSGAAFNTLKFRDEPRAKALDDPIHAIWGAGVSQLPQFGAANNAASAPFILSTGHHSMAWSNAFPSAFHKAVHAADSQLTQYKATIDQYVAADQRGELSDQDRAQAEQLYSEYVRVSNYLQQMVSGSGMLSWRS